MPRPLELEGRVIGLWKIAGRAPTPEGAPRKATYWRARCGGCGRWFVLRGDWLSSAAGRTGACPRCAQKLKRVDVYRRILAMSRAGASQHQIARELGVSRTAVRTALVDRREEVAHMLGEGRSARDERLAPRERSKLRVALVIPSTEAEGPGKRFAVWVQGCPIRCPGCCNAEMFPSKGGDVVDVRELAARAASTRGIEGVTILGGEPFAQAEAAGSFARMVRRVGLTVMTFTGYDLSELERRVRRGEKGVRRLLGASDLLVDGPYVREQHETRRRWVGSKNQSLRFLTDAYTPDDPRFRLPQTVEVRLEKGVLTVNGFPAGGLTRLRKRT